MVTVRSLSELWQKFKQCFHIQTEYEKKEKIEKHNLPLTISELIGLLNRRDYRHVEVENLLFLHHIKNGDDRLVVISVGGLVFSDALAKRLNNDYSWLKKQTPGAELVIMEKSRKPFYVTGVDKTTGKFITQPVNFRSE